MNNAKLWLVVKPTVGIPLFLSAVAISSFAVHVGIISTTDWIESYHQGKGINPAASAALEVPADGVAKVAFVPGKDDVLVKLPDGTMAFVTIQTPEDVAMATLPPAAVNQ
ncbi:MAG: light-harvesting protein [Gemmobacter sp.]